MALGKTQIAMLGHAADVPAETFAHARVLAESVGDEEALVAVLYVQFTRALVGAEFRRANDLAAELLQLGRRRRDRATLVMGTYAQGMVLIPLGPFGAARRLLKRATELYDPAERETYGSAMIGHPLMMMKAFLAYALIRLGKKDSARTMLDDAIAESERIGDAYALVNALWNRAYLAHVDEPAAAALSWADRAAKMADDCGALFFSAMAHGARGWAMARLGDLEVGLRTCREATDAYVATGGRLILPEHLTEQALIHGRMGDFSSGLRLLDQALAEADATGGRWVAPGAYAVKAHLLRRAGDVDAARAAALAAGAAARAIGQRLVPIGLSEA
jgi:tetratricopeptide (TPR) repeat protein